MLKKLDRPQDMIETISFTEEEFETLASKMADLGYIHTKASLDALKAYMSGYGLLLMGDVGTGKTFFFETLFKALKGSSIDEIILEEMGKTRHIIRMNDTIGESFEAIKDNITELDSANIAFDDIGVETGANDWGRKFELLPWLVETRMHASGRTHFTTNLSAEQLLERYGVRTVDRMHELTTVIEFKGKSLRRTRPNAIAVSDHKKGVAQRKALEELAKAHERYRNEHPNTDDDGAPF